MRYLKNTGVSLPDKTQQDDNNAKKKNANTPKFMPFCMEPAMYTIQNHLFVYENRLRSNATGVRG